MIPPGGLWAFFSRNSQVIKHWRDKDNKQSICFQIRDGCLESTGAVSDARSEASWFTIHEEQFELEDNDASQLPTNQEHEDSRTNASGNPKGEEVEETNVSASGGLGEARSSTNASLDDSRNAGALENSSWDGWEWNGRSWTKDGWTWAKWCVWEWSKWR